MRVVWVAAGSVLSALAVASATRYGHEIWWGMMGPLMVVIATWRLTARVYEANPERLTSVMIGAFAGKLVFFGAYVGLAIGVFGVQPVPFALSFTGYYIALHVIEALWLKRLFVS